MSPRFPQEIFDYIIDNNQFEDEVLRTYSTVCKGWAIRSRSHLFAQIFFSTPDNLEMWRKAIPPTVDGPSQLVRVLYVYSEVLPLVHGSQPLDPYLDHLSALTQVVGLVLGSYHDKVDLGMAFQCFSGFRSSLRWIKLSSNSFRFEEMSRILEYFPNLEGLALWSPSSPRSSENEPFPPLRRASFPHLNHLDFHLLSGSPSLELHILSGFAEASMDLEILSVLGPVSDPSVVQKLVDSSARSLTDLTLTPLGKSRSQCYAQTTLTIHIFLVVCRAGSFRVRQNPAYRG